MGASVTNMTVMQKGKYKGYVLNNLVEKYKKKGWKVVDEPKGKETKKAKETE